MHLLAVCMALLGLPAPARPTYRADVSLAPAATVLVYRLEPGESLRYKLTADIQGTIPLFGSTEPQSLHALMTLYYVATPKTRLADGTMDVEFRVEKPELEIEKIPFPIPDDQAHDVLDVDVTLAKTGEVVSAKTGKPLPFGVSVPGIDPKRLYALLFPIVFQTRPVRPGNSWAYKSELVSGEGAKPKFTATVVPVAGADSDAALQLRQVFQVAIAQKFDAEKKPVKDGAAAHRIKQGTIQGAGTYHFDRAKGRITDGVVSIRANIHDDLVGQPMGEDDKKQILSKVDAKVHVELVSSDTAVANPAEGKEQR